MRMYTTYKDIFMHNDDATICIFDLLISAQIKYMRVNLIRWYKDINISFAKYMNVYIPLNFYLAKKTPDYMYNFSNFSSYSLS